METDHTKAVEKRIEAIIIQTLDSCAFFQPKSGSLISVQMCAFCQFGEFKKNSHSGLCQYRLEKRGNLNEE